MLRLGPLHVNVKKGFGTEGASPGMGTDRMASLTCMYAEIEYLDKISMPDMPRAQHAMLQARYQGVCWLCQGAYIPSADECQEGLCY